MGSIIRGATLNREIDLPELGYRHLSKEARTRAAAEVVAGLRSEKSLRKFGVHLGGGVLLSPPEDGQ